jgi:hypothetical protein
MMDDFPAMGYHNGYWALLGENWGAMGYGGRVVQPLAPRQHSSASLFDAPMFALVRSQLWSRKFDVLQMGGYTSRCRDMVQDGGSKHDP